MTKPEDDTYAIFNAIQNIVMMVREKGGIIKIVHGNGLLSQIYIARLNYEEQMDSVGLFYKHGDQKPILLMTGTLVLMRRKLETIAGTIRNMLPASQKQQQFLLNGPDIEHAPTRNGVLSRMGYGIRSVFFDGASIRRPVLIGANLMAAAVVATIAIGYFTAGTRAGETPTPSSLPPAPQVYNHSAATDGGTMSHTAQASPSHLTMQTVEGAVKSTNQADVNVSLAERGPWGTASVPARAFWKSGRVKMPGLPGGGTLHSPKDFSDFGLNDG